ncbi:hypothetical protein [Streptomyces tubercidicus]
MTYAQAGRGTGAAATAGAEPPAGTGGAVIDEQPARACDSIGAW